MPYRLKPGEALAEGLRRIADEQVGRALDSLGEDEDRNEAVHDARKRFKKVRAVVRLIRKEIGEEVFERENVAYRDAGRRLSEVRDRFVFVETLDGLRERYAGELGETTFDSLRQELVRRHAEVVERLLDEEEAMAEVAEGIAGARRRIGDWTDVPDEFDSLEASLRKVYRRGLKRYREAREEPTAEALHEWRKRAKYLWYHTRILRPAWGPVLVALADEIHELTDYLGDDHDLAELRNLVLERPDLCGGDRELELLAALVEQRRAELQAAAFRLAERVYCEEPEAFTERLGAWWRASRRSVPLPAGGIAGGRQRPAAPATSKTAR